MNENELTYSFKALASETRRKIIYLLEDRCLCAGDIGTFSINWSNYLTSPKSISRGRIGNFKKVGLEIYYSLNIEKFNSLSKRFEFSNGAENIDEKEKK